jgi:AsmA protein
MNRKLLLWALGGVAALVAAAVVAIHLLVPTDVLRSEIESQVTQATGRSLRIHGALSLSLFPSIALDARDVTLANRPGGVAHDMARIERMRIGVRLFPLFSGKIEADAITLDHPVIALEVARDGRANWELSPTPGKPGVTGSISAKALFAGMHVTGATISYDNARHESHEVLNALDAEVDITRMDQPVRARGAFDYRGRRLDYAATIDTPRSLLAGRATKIDSALTAPFLRASFVGFLSSDGTAKGQASLRTGSFKDVAAWLGHPIAAGAGLGQLTVLGQLAADARFLILTDMRAKLDGMAIDGQLKINRERNLPPTDPRVVARLRIDRLDLNRYLDFGGAPAKSGAPGSPPSGGWSTKPIKLDAFTQFNALIDIDTGAMSVLHLKTGHAAIAVSISQGHIQVLLNQMQLYGGIGTAILKVDAGSPVPVLANALTFNNIAMRPFLADTIGVDRIEGTGTIKLNVTSKGASPDAVMHALSGTGAVAIGKGQVRGVDMGLVARTITTLISAGATGQSAVTAFDSFGGSFSIANGILWNGDLKLQSAFLKMKGAGHLDLGNQTIDYRLEPSASIGGRLNLLDIGVPFAITGPWSHVRYKPDLGGAVTGLVGNVIEKGTSPITGLIDGLTGSGDKPPPDKKKKSKSTGDKLKDLFGLH